MKFIHLSDLHIGKRVNEFSMIEDQEYILIKILNIIDEEKPQAVIIAGDVYDKSLPPTEAIELFNDFLEHLAKRNLTVLIISGNHDSPERLSFGNKIFDKSGIHISPTFNGKIKTIKLKDNIGEVNFHLLPFVKPANLRKIFPDSKIETYNDGIKVILDSISLDNKSRNVLITHQFVTGAITSDSEELSVGGSDNVDGSIFSDFDYVALGHLHRPQKILRDTIRYSGTPLKYSFSECNHKKSVTLVELKEKNDISIKTVELVPQRDLREIKGSYDEIVNKQFYENTNTNDYLHITLTDQEDVYDALAKLRIVYPNIMKLDYDNKRTRTSSTVQCATNVEEKTPLELFAELYLLQNGSELTKNQEEFLQNTIEAIWEDA
ncbi:MAG: exonuclease SbcCD subunit D [Filifactoraceae bacterium]